MEGETYAIGWSENEDEIDKDEAEIIWLMYDV